MSLLSGVSRCNPDMIAFVDEIEVGSSDKLDIGTDPLIAQLDPFVLILAIVLESFTCRFRSISLMSNGR